MSGPGHVDLDNPGDCAPYAKLYENACAQRDHNLREIQRLDGALAAMTAARDEACKIASEYTAQMLAVQIDEDEPEDVAMIMAVREVHIPRLKAVGS